MYSIYDILFMYSLISIWLMLLYHILLAYYGYKYHDELADFDMEKIKNMEDFPFISIFVPAHNEGKVIYYTVRSILGSNYPKDRFELIVINDNSSDDTGEVLDGFKEDNPNLTVITTTKENGGGKGKSAALNRALKIAKGEYIIVYDADNTPEKDAVRTLAYQIQTDPVLAAVCGKFRVRNKEKTMLTRFINLETLGFQWMSQGGRWRFLGLSTIPGTNFIIRKDVLNELGGWNEDAITEDTELSIRIYEAGYKIQFFPLAITWEQEPETWDVWMNQRTRWVRGNMYVIKKFFLKVFQSNRIAMDIIYFTSIYFLFLTSVLISDFLFIGNLLGYISLDLQGPYPVLWMLAFLLFIVEMAISVSLEDGEGNFKNILYIILVYFTYSQAWILLTLRSLVLAARDAIKGQKATWYKTERF